MTLYAMYDSLSVTLYDSVLDNLTNVFLKANASLVVDLSLRQSDCLIECHVLEVLSSMFFVPQF